MILPRSVPSKTLAQNLASDGAILYLNNTIDWDGGQLAAADFGDQLFVTVRNLDNSQVEYMELDPDTIDSNNAITILKRRLAYDGAQTETETAYNWLADDTIVELGGATPQLIRQMVEEAGAETVAGKKTFSDVPATTGGNPVTANDLVRKAYVDALLAGIASTVNLVLVGTAGETVADGDLLYYKGADGRWWKADADSGSTSENVILAIAQGAGTAGNAIAGGILLQGIDDAQAGLIAGTIYYASNTAGDISAVPGTKEVTIGMAQSATELYFNPRFNQGLTEDQQDALEGNDTSLPVGSTNKVVTQTGLQRDAENYAVTTGAANVYAASLSPGPAALTPGFPLRVKLNHSNTGPATMAINGGAAIAIKKTIRTGALVDVEAGDLPDTGIRTMVYDGAVWILDQLPPMFKVISTSRTQASGSGTQVISGVGFRPRLIEIIAVGQEGASGQTPVMSVGAYDGTTQGALASAWDSANPPIGAELVSTTQVVLLNKAEASTNNKWEGVAGNIGADGFDLVWTMTGTPGTVNLLIKCYA